MRRTGYLGTSLVLTVMLAASALPGLGQAAQGKAPQLRTQPEYNSYTACYNEKDPAKKADLCEKFVTDFKDSDYLSQGYTMIVQGYTGSKNWAKVMEAADRIGAVSAVDTKTKGFAYANAMVAAQNANNVDKVLAYGEKVLTVDPNDLNTLITMSATIPVKYPNDKAQLDKAADMATKAIAGLQPMLAKASAAEKPQLTQIDGTLHGTLGLIAFNQQNYKKSIAEYETAIKDNAKDDAAHFYLGYNYISLMAQASKDYQAALKAENDAKAAKADQPTIDDLAAKRTAFEDEIRKNRDKAIDELALATAIGGPVAQQAKTELTKQWTAKNDNTTGLEEFITQKKGQIGG
jgi:tetratricopeptide (TPR) repeat protein